MNLEKSRTDLRRQFRGHYAGLGGNAVDNALYPSAFTQPDGKPFDSSKLYVLHFGFQQVVEVFHLSVLNAFVQFASTLEGALLN